MQVIENIDFVTGGVGENERSRAAGWSWASKAFDIACDKAFEAAGGMAGWAVGSGLGALAGTAFTLGNPLGGATGAVWGGRMGGGLGAIGGSELAGVVCPGIKTLIIR